ncbi:MAG: hypothetical protein ACYC6L_03505 [Anaerolineae bacterium]
MLTQQQKDRLLPLIERVEEITAGAAIKARSAHWQRYYAGTPAWQDPEGPLFTMDIGLPTWSRILHFDLNAYMTDAFIQVENQLKMRIYHFEHFDDDTMVGLGVSAAPLGSALEPAVLGAPIDYQADTVPWVARDIPVIASREQLQNCPQPDFYTAGPMPQVHSMYAQAREMMADLTGSRWGVGFPSAIRGILGLAQTLRGPHENILIDMVEQPDFANEMFAYVTEFRMHFARERARFLGVPVGSGHIGNDEVTVPVVSPAFYEEFLLPREIELSNFHGGLTCWHSCGDTGALVHLISRIPNIKQFYTGPWTDLNRVMRAFGTSMPLDIAVHVVDDMLAASPERMRAKMLNVIDTCGGAPLKLRAGSTDSVFGLQADLAKARQWTEIARQVALETPSRLKAVS